MSNKRIYTADAPPVFQRWVPMQLDETVSKPEPPAADEQPVSEENLLDYLEQQNDRVLTAEPEAVETVQAPDPAELEALREEARQDGYQDGLEKGREQAARERQQLHDLFYALDAQNKQLQSGLASAVLDLALDLTRHLLRAELQLKPEHIISLVQDLVQALPQPGGHPRLHLQADDAELVRSQMGSELDILGWKIVPDASLQRGDCLVETHHGELNATLNARWAQLCDSLGRKVPLQPLDADDASA